MAVYHTFKIGEFSYELSNVTAENKDKGIMTHLSDNAEMFELKRIDPITAKYRSVAILVGDVPAKKDHLQKCRYTFSAIEKDIFDSVDIIAVPYAIHFLEENRYAIV